MLNPEWLTKAIGYVIEDAPTRLARGVLDHARLREIWDENRIGPAYPVRHHRYFLRLMEKFDICYRLEGTSSESGHHSLIAQLVPRVRPRLPWSFLSPLSSGIRQISLSCDMGEEAPGIISWMTVRHHAASVGRHWRGGVFLRHPTAAYASEALIELQGDRRLLVQVRAPSPDMFFNVIRDGLEYLLQRRWPGLTYQLHVPCPARGCDAQFPLHGLTRARERGRHTQNCLSCDAEHNISTLLTGFPEPRSDLRSELDRIRDEVADVSLGVERLASGMNRIEVLATQSTDSLRRVVKAVATEVVDCPRIFTLLPAKDSPLQRFRFGLDRVRLTLWCEHPGEWHPWEQASYELSRAKETLHRIGPYAALVLKGLRLVVPITVAVAGVILPKPNVEAISRQLDLMTTIVDKLPQQISHHQMGPNSVDSSLTLAEGAGLRALRSVLFALDETRHFGDLRRVLATTGDHLWVCPQHYREYDPGLPNIPA